MERKIPTALIYEQDFQRAVDLMISHEDKRWSLTDCITFVLMRELEVRDAFTFDRNFAEAGFRTQPG